MKYTKIYMIFVLAGALHASAQQPQVFTYSPEKNSFELTETASGAATISRLPTGFDKASGAKKKDIAALETVLSVKDLRRIVIDYMGDDWVKAGNITKDVDIFKGGVSPDFTYIAVQSGEDRRVTSLEIWKRVDDQYQKIVTLAQDEPSSVQSINFSLNGRFLIVAALNGITVWERSSDSFQKIYSIKTDTTRALISSDGNNIIIQKGKNLALLTKVGKEYVNVDSIEAHQQEYFEGARNAIQDMAISRDGTLLAEIASDGILNIWLLDNKFSLLQAIQLPTEFIDLTLSPDGQYLAVSSSKQIRVYKKQKSAYELWRTITTKGDVDKIVIREFTADGSSFVTESLGADAYSKSQIWDLQGTSYKPKLLPGKLSFQKNIFSPDGIYFAQWIAEYRASFPKEIQVWFNQARVIEGIETDTLGYAVG